MTQAHDSMADLMAELKGEKAPIKKQPVKFDENGNIKIESFTIIFQGFEENGFAISLNELPTNIVSSLNLSDNERISSITLGGSHTGVLTSSGRVFSWGWNIYGQLGNRSNIQRNTPTEITSRFNLDDEDVILKLKYGQFTSSAISKSGQVFMWGLNTNGQLGDATTTNRNLPVNISSKFSLNTGEYIIDLSLGISHSSALTSDGRLYTWGRNNHGQLGDALTSQRNVPEEITNQFNLGFNEFVEFISLDNNHSIALTNLNRVFVWGSNGNGRLGDGTTQNRSLPLELLFNAVNIFNNETINFDVKLQKPNDPIKQGYTFDGWYIDLNSFTTAYEFTTMPANNLNLFGRFKLAQYSITYDLDGGINAPNNPSTYMFNDSISLIAPTKLGYTFMGFYLDEEFSERIERIDENIFGNIILYAKWDQFVFEVRLDLDNGTYLGETVFIKEFDTPIIL
jgi:uncharacterized repeat protein (TIGR02543 family)